MGGSQPFPWRAEIGPPETDPGARAPETWVTKNWEDRDNAIQATLRSFATARQYLTETKFSSSERLIRFFEGVTASMSRNPSSDAFEFARRAFESVVRYGSNESMSMIAEKKEFEDGEARLLTLQAFHNLAVVHHRRWMHLWEEQTGFESRIGCARTGEANTPANDCKTLKAREMATLSYEAAHRYYECVITNSSREGEARGGHTAEIFAKPIMLTALMGEDEQAATRLKDAAAAKDAIDSRMVGDARQKPSKKEMQAAKKTFEEAREEKDRSEKALREVTSYRDSLFGRRLAVLLLASMGLLELIVQGRIRWKLSFQQLGAPVRSARELDFDGLLRLAADLVKMAETFERIPSVDGMDFSGIEMRLRHLYSATPAGDSASPNGDTGLKGSTGLNTLPVTLDSGPNVTAAPGVNTTGNGTSADLSSHGLWRIVSDAWRWFTGKARRFSKLADKTNQQERTDSTTGFRDPAEPRITSAFENELEKICIERKRQVEKIGEDGNVKLEQLIRGGERISSRLKWREEGDAECLSLLKP